MPSCRKSQQCHRPPWPQPYNRYSLQHNVACCSLTFHSFSAVLCRASHPGGLVICVLHTVFSSCK